MEDQSNQTNHSVSESLFALGKLLQDGVVADNPGWQSTLATKKVFYIRGYSWFRDNVGKVSGVSQDTQAKLIQDMKEIVSKRTEWSEHRGTENEEFSFRLQVSDALGSKRASQKLHKALGTLGVCEAFLRQKIEAGETQVSVKDMYSNMRIQPACFYISNFTADFIEQVREVDSKVLSKLEDATGQLRHSVFHEMALSPNRSGSLRRKLVTRDLAEGVFKALQEIVDENDRLKALDPGKVSCVFDSSIPGQKASNSEHIRF